MDSLEEQAAYWIERLDGRESEDAFHRLIECPTTVVPLLINAYAREERPAVKAAIVGVVNEFRHPEIVGFLSRILAEDDADIWKEALDGLVSIGNGGALEVLRKAQESLRGDDRLEWIREAVEQIRSGQAETTR